jgi:hypothetical protein
VTGPVIRNRAWVEREYEREKYPPLLAAAQRALAQGERSLARVVGQIIDCERGTLSFDTMREIVAHGTLVSLPAPLASAAVSGAVTQLLATALPPKAETIVELGAGWGRNLFQLYLSGLAPKTARFYALELAASARMTAVLLRNLEPALSLAAIDFDFHAPAYDLIPASACPALVVTVHAIEQMPVLSPEVFTDLIARLPDLAGLHIEPVGFQISPTSHASAAYAEKNDYNRNLVSVLQTLVQEGRIEITETRLDFLGLHPRNPATIIRWRTKR